jgi:long-chain acyl-CoA synthetase
MLVLDPSSAQPPTVVHALRESVQRYSGQVALSSRGQALTYAELGDAVLALAERLLSEGVRGQRVAVLMPTSIEAVVSVFGVLAAGAQLVPINPFFTRSELRVVLDEAEAALVLCGAEAWPKLCELGAEQASRRLCWGSAADGLTLSALLERAAGEPRLGALRPGWARLPVPLAHEPAVAIFTGGTTGEPKAVEHTHASAMVSVLQHCTVWPVRPGIERFASSAPLFHIWGLFYSTFVPIFAGGTLVLVPRYDAEELLGTIEAERITVFGGGPAPVYLGLLSSPRMAHTDFSSLVYCLSGGAPCPLDLHERWRRQTGCALLEGWGMSEAAPLCLSDPARPKPMSVGRPVPDTEVEVVDLEHGRERIEAGAAGELRVRGPQVMLGYRGRSDATRSVLRDGWLYTGDVGYFDAEGDLFLVDRKKDMIIVGGFNVYPRQVDEVLYRHPEIAEAATVGRPDARLGEVLVAFVVREHDAELDEAAFFAFCREELVKYRRPVSVTFLGALPRTNARKVDKKALRKMALKTSASEPASADEARRR